MLLHDGLQPPNKDAMMRHCMNVWRKAPSKPGLWAKWPKFAPIQSDSDSPTEVDPRKQSKKPKGSNQRGTGTNTCKGEQNQAKSIGACKSKVHSLVRSACLDPRLQGFSAYWPLAKGLWYPSCWSLTGPIGQSEPWRKMCPTHASRHQVDHPVAASWQCPVVSHLPGLYRPMWLGPVGLCEIAQWTLQDAECVRLAGWICAQWGQQVIALGSGLLSPGRLG